MPQKSCKILEIDHPLEEYELVQLKDRDYKEIYLHSVYIGYEESGIFVKKTSLTISPEVVNPEVEVLSLKCCGITDTLIKGIEEFMALRKLVLFSNHITDASVISAISQLKSLKSLSLINEEISNASVPAVLAMPNLTELDLSHNERINDEIAETLFKHTNLKKLNVRFTGLTRQQQRRLENKYKDLNGK
jgi:Leucine-rich repeat (LRR) protein